MIRRSFWDVRELRLPSFMEIKDLERGFPMNPYGWGKYPFINKIITSINESRRKI